MDRVYLKNISLFANSGIGEFGTKKVSLLFDNKTYEINTVIANELLEERANLYKLNYPNVNMIIGDITQKSVLESIKDSYLKELPLVGTFSPPCQGSSGLNAHKNTKQDFRNQLVKAIFQLLNNKDVRKNPLEFGYIENVVPYYSEEIPSKLYSDFERPQKPSLFHEYVYNEKNEIINYKYMMFHKDIEVIDYFCKVLEANYEIETFIIADTIYYGVGFNDINQQFSKIENKSMLIQYIRALNKEISLIIPEKIETYIKESFQEIGYFTTFISLDGTNCKCPQIRRRTFCIFSKYITLDTKQFNKKNEVSVEEVFIKNSLIKKVDLSKYSQDVLDEVIKNNITTPQRNLNYKIIDGYLYVDNIHSEEKAKEAYKKYKNGLDVHTSQFLHTNATELNDRYKVWLNYTKENSSAYFNESRVTRPYKLSKISNKIDKKSGLRLLDIETIRDMDFVIEEDTKEYFEKHNIIDYSDFITDDMKKLEGVEWEDKPFDGVKKDGRKWFIRNKKSLQTIEDNMLIQAKCALLNGKEYVYLFSPILGFEKATYKRIPFKSASNALTTKMNYGNSNTAHPIFDRLLTPYEVMILFTLDVNKDMYPSSEQYLVPKDKATLKSLHTFVYEICGEAIIPLVSTYLLEEYLKVSLEFKQQKVYAI